LALTFSEVLACYSTMFSYFFLSAYHRLSLTFRRVLIFWSRRFSNQRCQSTCLWKIGCYCVVCCFKREEKWP